MRTAASPQCHPCLDGCAVLATSKYLFQEKPSTTPTKLSSSCSHQLGSPKQQGRWCQALLPTLHMEIPFVDGGTVVSFSPEKYNMTSSVVVPQHVFSIILVHTDSSTRYGDFITWIMGSNFPWCGVSVSLAFCLVLVSACFHE